MIKLTDEEAEALLMVLAYVRREGPSIWRHAQENEPRYEAYLRERDRDENSALFPPPTRIATEHADTIMASMTKQLSYDGPNTDGTLIDIVAEALQNPHAVNVLGGRALEQLRKAILTPEERVTLRERLATSMSCNQCGVEFRSGDVGTISGGGLTCTRCEEPQWVHCEYHGCERRVELPASGKKFFAKTHYCVDHTGRPSPSPPPIDQGYIDYGTHRGAYEGLLRPGAPTGVQPDSSNSSRLRAAAERLRGLQPFDMSENAPIVQNRAPRTPR